MGFSTFPRAQLAWKPRAHAGAAFGVRLHRGDQPLILEAANVFTADLIRDIKSGFYITSLMGMGVTG